MSVACHRQTVSDASEPIYELRKTFFSAIVHEPHRPYRYPNMRQRQPASEHNNIVIQGDGAHHWGGIYPPVHHILHTIGRKNGWCSSSMGLLKHTSKINNCLKRV